MTKDEKDERILAALISNPSTRAAAQACHVSETHIYERLRDRDFKARYDKARLSLLDETTAALQKHLRAAVEGMANIAEDQTAPAQVRLNACEGIIRCSLKMTEQVEILKRIEQLETATNAAK